MGAIRGHGGCKSGIIAVVQFGNESESILKVDRIDHYALGITSGVSLRLSQNVWTVTLTRGRLYKPENTSFAEITSKVRFYIHKYRCSNDRQERGNGNALSASCAVTMS